MKAMIYLQAFVSSKDVVNIGTAIVKDPDTGLSCKYHFCTNYTPGGEHLSVWWYSVQRILKTQT